MPFVPDLYCKLTLFASPKMREKRFEGDLTTTPPPLTVRHRCASMGAPVRR